MRDRCDVGSALSSRFAIHTSDPDIARRHFCETAGAKYFITKKSDTEFRFDGIFMPTKDITVAFPQFNGAVELEFPASEFVRQVFHYSGSGNTSALKSAEISASHPYALIPQGERYTVHSKDFFSYVLVRINVLTLLKKLGSLLGETIPSDFRFLDSKESPSVIAYRCAGPAIALLLEQANGKEYSETAIAELEQSLITNFIFSHKHRLSGALQKKPLHASNQKICMVEEYIAEHWNDPLNINNLAEITNTSARSLFRHFRDARGSSPWEFVKSIRLRNARQMLLDKSSDQTILGIALYCGFQNASHFSKDYRRAFGELPSDTVMRKSK